MRTALIALALVACSTPAPAPQVDGGIAGDSGPIADAGGDSAIASCRTRCTPTVDCSGGVQCEASVDVADQTFCATVCGVDCGTAGTASCSASAWQCSGGFRADTCTTR